MDCLVSYHPRVPHLNQLIKLQELLKTVEGSLFFFFSLWIKLKKQKQNLLNELLALIIQV